MKEIIDKSIRFFKFKSWVNTRSQNQLFIIDLTVKFSASKKRRISGVFQWFKKFKARNSRVIIYSFFSWKNIILFWLIPQEVWINFEFSLNCWKISVVRKFWRGCERENLSLNGKWGKVKPSGWCCRMIWALFYMIWYN